MLDDGTNRYVWGPNGLAYTVRKATGVAYVYHADGQGSVRAITDGNNAAGTSAAVVQTYVFDEFGVPTVEKQTSAGVNPENDFGYTGELRDSQVGLMNLRARMYDPALGRFLQKDGYVGFRDRSASLNRYSYVENNPLTHRDPSGHAIKPGTPLVGPVSKNLALQVQPMPWPDAPVVLPAPTAKPQATAQAPTRYCPFSAELTDKYEIVKSSKIVGDVHGLVRGPEGGDRDCHVNLQVASFGRKGLNFHIRYDPYTENFLADGEILYGGVYAVAEFLSVLLATEFVDAAIGADWASVNEWFLETASTQLTKLVTVMNQMAGK